MNSFDSFIAYQVARHVSWLDRSTYRAWKSLLCLALVLPALRAQAQGRPPQYQIPTRFDSVYTKRPARLAFFIAWEYCGGGQIEWVTLREGKIAAFTVQYSPDGQSWQSVSQVPPTPGARAPHIYTFYDSNLRRYGRPVLYYRVQQLAHNGRCTYSPVRSIRLHNPDTPWRTAAPPPATMLGIPPASGR